MNNWARFKEKLTVWVIRFSTEARMKYWGLTNLSPPDARRVVGLLQARQILAHAPSADLTFPIPAFRLLWSLVECMCAGRTGVLPTCPC